MKNDSPVSAVYGKDIESALTKEYRQYQAGRLMMEQKHLSHIEDDIEVGISHYEGFTADKPHMHPVATEHGYVLEGALRLRLLDGTKEEYEFRKGDFFVLQKGVPYATKNAAGTRILFIKSPGGNDKTVVEVDSETTLWLSDWDAL